MPTSTIGWLEYFVILIIQLAFLGLSSKKYGFYVASHIGFFLITISAVLQVSILGLNGDQASYFKMATELSDKHDFEALLESAGVGKFFVPLFAGISYIFLSRDPILFIQLMITLSFLIPMIVGKTVAAIGYPRFANKSALISSCFPWIIIWAPRFGRESLAFMILLSQVVVLVLFWQQCGSRRIYLYSLVLVFAAAFVRPQLSVGLCLALSIRQLQHISNSFRNRIQLSKKFFADSFFVTTICLIPFLFLKESELLRFLIPTQLKSIKDSNAGIGGRPEQILGKVSESNIDSFFSVIFGPYPFEWKNLSMVIIGFDGTLFAILLCVLVFSRIYFKELKSLLNITFLLLLPLIVGATIQFANYGLNFRIRAHLYVVTLVALSLSIQLMWEKLNSIEKT